MAHHSNRGSKKNVGHAHPTRLRRRAALLVGLRQQIRRQLVKPPLNRGGLSSSGDADA